MPIISNINNSLAMKRLLFLLTLALMTMPMLIADEPYVYNDYYWQRSSLFEKLPIDTADIVFVGNSLTDNGEWHELFRSPAVKNRGIISDVVQGISDRIGSVTAGHPRKIFLLSGANDISHHITADSLARAMEKLIVKIKEQSSESEIYLQSLLPINNDFHRYRNLVGTEQVFVDGNALLEQVAKRQGVTWVNLFPAFADAEGKLRKELTADGLHVNAEGYRIWRREVSKYVGLPFDDEGEVYPIGAADVVMVGNGLIAGCEWHELLRCPQVKARPYYAAEVAPLPQAAAAVAAAKPAKIFLLAAYDRLSGDFAPDTVVRTVGRAIREVKRISPATTVVVMGLVPVSPAYEKYATFADVVPAKIQATNRRLRDIAKRNGAKWVDLMPVLADDNGHLRADYTNDGFHLMGNGYAAWGEALAKFFR